MFFVENVRSFVENVLTIVKNVRIIVHIVCSCGYYFTYERKFAIAFKDFPLIEQDVFSIVRGHYYCWPCLLVLVS